MSDEEKRIRIVIDGNAEGATSALGGVSSGLSSILEIAGGILTSQVITQVFDSIISGVSGLFNAAVEEEGIMTLLSQGVEHLGAAAAMTVPQMVALAEKLGQTTLFSEDLVKAGENILMRFTAIGTETFPRVVQSAADLATVMGMDLPNTMRLLGRALEDPIAGMSSLRRYNIILTEAQKEQIKSLQEQGNMMGAQAVILDALDKAFGGAAEAMGGTFAGQQAIFKNNMDQISEILGGAVLPLMTGLNKVLNAIATNPQIMDFFKYLGEKLGAAMKPLVDLTDAFLAGFGPGSPLVVWVNNVLAGLGKISPVFTWIAEAIRKVIDFVERLGSAFQFSGFSIFFEWMNGGPLEQAIANIREFFGGDWTSVIEATKSTLQKYGEYLLFLFNTFNNFVMSQVVPFLVKQFTKVTDWLLENKPLIQAFIVVLNEIVQAFIKGMEWMITKIFGLWDVITPLLSGIVDLVLSTAKLIMQIFTGDWAGAWETAKTIVVGVALAIWDAVVALLNWIAGLFGSSLQEIGAIWAGVWNAMKLTVTLVWGIIATFFTGALATFSGFWIATWNTISTFWAGVWNGIETTAVNIWYSIATFFMGALATVSGFWIATWNTISTFWTGVWNGIKTTAVNIWNSIATFFTGAWATFSNFWTTTWNTLSTFYTGVWNSIKLTATSIWNSIAAFFTGAWATFSGFWKGVWNSIASIVSTIGAGAVSNATTVINNLWNGIKGVWTSISGWWSGVWNAMVSVVSGFGGSLYSAGYNIVTGLLNGLKASFGNLDNWWKGTLAQLIAKAKAILGLKSPSTVFFDMGENIIKGLVGGLGKDINVPVNMIGNLGANMIGAMGGASNSSTSNAMTINISGSDPRAVVDELMQRFKLQGIKFSTGT